MCNFIYLRQPLNLGKVRRRRRRRRKRKKRKMTL
jgi:hypothetical protein